MKNQKQIPAFFSRCFRWFCRKDLYEELQGDLEETFYNNVKTHGLSFARKKYRYEVFKLIRPSVVGRNNSGIYTLNRYGMFRHNLLITYRNFRRFKASFFINLVGLSTGIACALLIFLWVNDELSIDRFHENGSQLYQVMEHSEEAGYISTSRSTSGPIGAALAEEMPEVVAAATALRMGNSNYTLSVNDSDMKATGLYVSADYFKLFSYELIQGQEDLVLSDKKSMVISEDLAMALFGTTKNVIGEVVEWEHEKQLSVSGVFRNIAANSSVRFDFVLSFEGFSDEHEWVTNWYHSSPKTYVLLREGTDIDQFNSKIVDLIRDKTEGKASHRSPFITSYADAYLYNHYENGQQAGGRIEYVWLFSIVALFILLIACINFMNLSTARASRRMREIGVKKVMGANRRTLILQYLGESTAMALLSLVVALVFVAVFLPQFNLITEKQLSLDFNVILILSLLGMVLLTGLMAGSYPALYLSGFSPNMVLKGKSGNFMGELWARKGLVIIQFTLSVILIVSVWVVYKQVEFVQTKNLGYEKDNIIFFRKEGLLWEKEKSKTFLLELKNIPGVIDASAIAHDMTGHYMSTYAVNWAGKDPEDRTSFENITVDYGMMALLGIEMKAGRGFSEAFGADTTKIIFNEAAIEFMGLTDPIGKIVKLYGEDKEIIGIAKDFHFESFHEQVKPLFFRLTPRFTTNVMAKIEAGKEKETMKNLRQFYQAFNPGFPFDYKFLDEEYQALYAAEKRVAILSRYFAILAVLISCLGLFGLAAFTAERRIKEIGIRKILGSSEIGIFYLLSGDFTKMVLVAILIALPLSYHLTRQWLENFAFHIDLEWWLFASSGVLALLIAWLTVGIHTFKAARANPVECLKDE